MPRRLTPTDFQNRNIKQPATIPNGDRTHLTKEEAIEVEGRVKEALANTQFRVELDVGGEIVAGSPGRSARTPSA